MFILGKSLPEWYDLRNHIEILDCEQLVERELKGIHICHGVCLKFIMNNR